MYNINLPNFFTILRLFLIPVFIIFFDCFQISRWIFLFAIITDFLDGIIARATNRRTEIGSILDPLADKLLVVTAFLLLASNNILPSWYAVVIISRDFFILLGWIITYIVTSSTEVAPSFIGKLSNFTQATLVFIYMLQLPPKYIMFVEYYSYLMLALTIVSGMDYIIKGSKKLAVHTASPK